VLEEGTAPRYERADITAGPGELALWTEFHTQVAALPEDEREVFDLLYYQNLPRADAAALLNVSVKTLVRRWQKACERLHQATGGGLPGPGG
jgi:DNA-directed RNA polymerase specialized sigma24 family protein